MCDKDKELTIFGLRFWDLWAQKIFRNFASVKYQWMTFMFVMTVYGMLVDGHWVNETTWVAKIPAALGMGFLGAGFITLALGRIYVKTRLIENDNEEDKELDTDN